MLDCAIPNGSTTYLAMRDSLRRPREQRSATFIGMNLFKDRSQVFLPLQVSTAHGMQHAKSTAMAISYGVKSKWVKTSQPIVCFENATLKYRLAVWYTRSPKDRNTIVQSSYRATMMPVKRRQLLRLGGC